MPCMAEHETGYLCTEPVAHRGDHVAADSDGRVCATWAAGMVVFGLGETYETRRAALCLDMSTDGRWFCTLTEGHGPLHQSHGPDGDLQAEWVST